MTVLQDFLNSPVRAVAPMRGAGKQGDLFGVEIELEGNNVTWDGKPAIMERWAPHNDGSLRAYKGSPACEWVFNGPANYKQSVERINELFDYLEKQKAKIVCSNRTSVHVHFNMSDKTTYQLINMFILFTILEDLMDRYCGEDRNGNLFCLSARHAQRQIDWVEDACFKNRQLLFKENQRYCSFNIAAINKFGSVEFRGMRGLDNREDVIKWLDILNDFCKYACYEMRNPSELIENISKDTPLGFIKKIFSKDNFLALTKGIDEDEIERSVYEGLRLVQMLCYRIGTEFDQVRLRGPDFWASLNKDQEAIPDVPADVLAERVRGRPIPRPRGGRVQMDLEAINPFNNGGIQAGEAQIVMAGGRNPRNPLGQPPQPQARRVRMEDQWDAERNAWVRIAVPAEPVQRPDPHGRWIDQFEQVERAQRHRAAAIAAEEAERIQEMLRQNEEGVIDDEL